MDSLVNHEKMPASWWRTGLLVLLLVFGFFLVMPLSDAAAVSCGSSVGPGGTVTLTSDLKCDGDGLYVHGPVTLDLDGHTISCTYHGLGILIRGHGATVMNGRVTKCDPGIASLKSESDSGGGNAIFGMEVDNNSCFSCVESFEFFGSGIYIEDGGGDSIVGNVIRNNEMEGLKINGGGSNAIFGNTFRKNGDDGVKDNASYDTYTGNFFFSNGDPYATADCFPFCGEGLGRGLEILDSHNTILGNIANNNNMEGIYVSGHSNTIVGNAAKKNGTYDLWDNNSDCDSNTWNANSFRSRNRTCIH